MVILALQLLLLFVRRRWSTIGSIHQYEAIGVGCYEQQVGTVICSETIDLNISYFRRVVTGMRFVKKNRIIHLIVQQGTLLPRGQIDNTTLEWLEAESYNILSPNVRNGRDYHTLSYDNRILDLDDLIVEPSYVLTGVRFRLLGSHLNMEIRMTEMDFATGKLVDPDKSIWIGSDKTEHSEEKR